MNARSLLKSMRLRATPLVLAGIVTGVSLAAETGPLKAATVIFLALTAVCLQIVSNLSNELGDYISGLDTDDRQGMRYSLMDGEMTVNQMLAVISVSVILSCVSGCLMIWNAFGSLFSPTALFFIALGVCAIVAALRYTLGPEPYGYRGLGDIFVFIFFGLVTVLGACYICSNELPRPLLLLPASSIGCFSVGVLNVNNIRDMKTDSARRVTMAIRFGERGARVYHTVLIILGWVLMLVFCLAEGCGIWQYLFVLTAPLFLKHLKGVWKGEGKSLDPLLPMLVISTFLFTVLFCIGTLI